MKNLILVLILFITSLAYSQVEITTKSGEVFHGLITHNNQDSLILKELSGTKISIPHHHIKLRQSCVTTLITTPHDIEVQGAIIGIDDSSYTLVNYQHDTVNILKSRVSSIDIKTVKGSLQYPLAGLTFFMPGGINAVLGYQFDFGFGARITAGTLGENYGYQANILYNTLKSRHIECNISIGGGYTNMKFATISNIDNETSLSPNFYYLGGFIDINLYGVYLESQMIIALDGSRTLITGLSLGYVYRFN